MKVDFVMNPYRGGGPRNVYILSHLLNERGYTSDILTFGDIPGYRPDQKPYSDELNINLRRPGNLLSFINKAMSLSDNLTYFKSPIFQIQQRITRVRALGAYKSPDVYISTFWQSVFPTMRVAQKNKKRQIYFVQANEATFGNNKFYSRKAEATYRLPLTKFTQSKWLQGFLNEKYSGNTEYIGIGIDHNKFKKKGFSAEDTVFTIARGGKDKGFDVFIKAMNSLHQQRRDFKVLIAGDPQIIERARLRYGIEFDYECLGWIYDDQKLAELYEKCIFVNTGRTEALPMPPLEAMACGSSVVMTDMPGGKEYARDGLNSLLCSPGDYGDFSEKIDKLISSKSLRQRLSEKAIETASVYTWTKVLDRFVSLLSEIT